MLNIKREKLGPPLHEQILTYDGRYMHYSRNKKRFIIKEDRLCRQYYFDLGEAMQLQVLLPGHLLKVLLTSLLGTAGKHPGISKMTQNSDKSITSVQSQHISETGSASVKYACKANA